jgi:AraC-like DNA-binding protein
MEPTVSTKALRAPIFAASVKTGEAPNLVAASVGIAVSLLNDLDERVPHSLVVRVWDELAARASDPDFGLFAASLLDAAPLDLVDFALSSAPDLRGLIEGFLRSQRLFHDANVSSFRVEKDHVVATLELGVEARRNRQLSEFVLGTWCCKFRRALGPRFGLAGVRMRDEAPRSIAPFQRVFGDVAYQFGAAEDALVLPAALLDAPLVGADGEAWSRLQGQLDAALAKRDPEPAFVSGARRRLRVELAQGRADAEALARALAVSTRSLQRRLAEQGTTFSSLLDEVRCDLALAQMNGDTSMTEVAFLLGFSDLSSFSKAFRRWTGKSPSTYRQAAR